MLGVDESGSAAVGLRRRDDGQRQRGFARGLRAEYFNDSAARNAADPERNIKSQRTGRNRIHLVGRAGVAQAHDRAFAKLFFDLTQRGRESFFAILFHGHSSTKCAAIISYSAANARLICNEFAEFSSGFYVSSSSGQVSTTVYADPMPPVSERTRLKCVVSQEIADIACSTGGCATFLASVTCARSCALGKPVASCSCVHKPSRLRGVSCAAATTTRDGGQNSSESSAMVQRGACSDPPTCRSTASLDSATSPKNASVT